MMTSKMDLLQAINTEAGRYLLGIEHKDPIFKVAPNCWHTHLGFDGKKHWCKAKFYQDSIVTATLLPILTKMEIASTEGYGAFLHFSGLETKNYQYPSVFLVTDPFTSDVADGGILSEDTGSSYNNAREGLSTLATDNSDVAIIGRADRNQSFGQESSAANRWVHQGFVKFDTSTIQDDATLSQVDFETNGEQIRDNEGGGWTAGARISDWGAALTTGDFVAGSSLGALTQVATMASTLGNGLNDWTELSAFKDNISLTGTTFLILVNEDQTDNHPPTAARDRRISSADHGTAANRPNIDVTYTVPAIGGGAPYMSY